MKRIIVYAYTRLNLGDDLFVKILCDRYSKHEFIIICPKKYSLAFKEIKNLQCISFESVLARGINFLFRKLNYSNFLEEYFKKKCEISVTIGGSLFMQNSNWENGIINMTKRAKENKFSYILGANFGPYIDKEYRNTHEVLFSKFHDVCFRDSYSYDLFKNLNNVRKASDIIFQLGGKTNINSDRKILISVIKPSERVGLKIYEQDYYKIIREVIKLSVSNEIKVELMSFCKDEGDELAIDEILKEIPKEFFKSRYISTYYYNGNIEEALEEIGNCSYVIATRFHSMILGYIYNKPTFPIIYSEKMKNVIDDIDDNINYVDMKNIMNISAESIMSYLRENKKLNLNSLKNESNNHFLELDKQLLS